MSFTPKTYIYITNGDQRAADLRGVTVFFTMAMNATANLWIGPMTIRPAGMVRALVTNPTVPSFFQQVKANPHARTIADLTFNVERLDETYGSLPVDDPLFDHEQDVVRSTWSDPATVAALRECVALADAVTTPNMAWVPSFVDHRKVFHLPDLDPTSPDDSHRFEKRLTEIWEASGGG